MSAPSSDPKFPSIPVGEFYARHSEALQLTLACDQIGFDRRIREPTINRPGLALAGFYSLLRGPAHPGARSGGARLPAQPLRARCPDALLRALLAPHPLPGRRARREAPAALSRRPRRTPASPLFRTEMVTMKFINAATLALEFDFAPTKSEYGSMVDIMGIGTLIRGSSGIGKSECVLGLIERGHSLVSDDMTRFRALEGRELIGTSPDLTRHHMEVRGLGVINVMSIFGIGSVRLEKRLDLIVTLKDWQELEEVDRIGLDQEYYEILDILVPHITIPVRTGRDLARLVEVAALDQKLKSMGQNSALEFNQRLLNLMQKKKEL